MRLLGMDMKMRQYELGKAFCDAVVAEGGHRAAQPGLGVARGAADGPELERPERTGSHARARA